MRRFVVGGTFKGIGRVPSVLHPGGSSVVDGMLIHSQREPVRAAILYSLEHYCHENAVFLAERLYDEVGDVESLYLLATCLYRSGRLQQARHLLSKLRPSSHAPSNLLHATICLDLDDPNGAVLALQSSLCFKESSEADMAAYYSSDAGIAFWLLGRSYRLLHNHREAARHFRSCLKFNPFLWTAFEALTSMGEAVSPEECFNMTEYPPFLPPPLLGEVCPPHPPQHPSSSTSSHPHSSSSCQPITTTDVRPSENCVPTPDDRLSLAGKKPSAFTPVDTNRVGYVTPDLFAEPGVGKAVASSTPLPRALAFTRVCDPSSGSSSGGGGGGGGEGVGRVVVGGATRGGVGVAGLDVGSVRMVLDFGSAPKSSGSGGGGGGGSSDSPSNTPVFGVLPVSHCVAPLPVSSSGVVGQGTTTTAGGVTPDLVSPSWSARPSHFTRQLLTAPVAPKKRVSHTIPPPTFKFPPTPDVQDCLADPSLPTNQISPSWSRDTFITPPPISSEGSSPVVTVEMTKSPHQSSKLPLKSALRRSERLRKSGTTVASAQRKVGISNLVHSSNASKFRHKSGVRDGDRSPRKGSRCVSGGTPVSSRGSPRKPSSGPKTGALITGGGGGGGGGGRGGGGEWEGGGSGEAGREVALRLAEQQAMASIGALMHLLQQVGTAYQCLHGYDLTTSLRCFRSLPPRHRGSAWCLTQMARAYHCGERYCQAAKLFREVHSMDPHRQDGMEMFASCLWHLRCDVELSVLADSLLTSDTSRVEGACAKATSLNLARDHEGAVKCLQRAVSLSPRFPYAHTLLGHEYVMLKDFEKAMSSFQTAVSLDPRHYNAWYGMAHVCFSQERYRLSEVYITKALVVNKSSAICCTQLALVQFRQKNHMGALRLLNTATQLCHSNPIPRFHKAKVLESLGQNEEALLELEELSRRWPKEPNIYISMGKLLKKLKRPHEAVLNFSWALDFSRQGNNSHIREEVDEMYQVADTEGRNEEEDFFIHPSNSEDPSQLREGEGEEGEEMQEEGGGGD